MEAKYEEVEAIEPFIELDALDNREDDVDVVLWPFWEAAIW